MITFLRGKLIEAIPTQAIIDVNGVGYEVLIPLSSFEKLPAPGQEVHLLTHLAVREDAHVLYGFMRPREREIFRMLISTVKGVGPKLALKILSGTNPVSFGSAVVNGDVKALSSISGVGKKTAERIIVDLRDRFADSAKWEAASDKHGSSSEDLKINDAVLALTALGFKPDDAHKSVKAALAMLGDKATVEELVRASLKK
mgnify:CR=1 FL=1